MSTDAAAVALGVRNASWRGNHDLLLAQTSSR
jgi:hypothetical protein